MRRLDVHQQVVGVLAFPTGASASFFSTTLLEPGEPFDFVKLFTSRPTRFTLGPISVNLLAEQAHVLQDLICTPPDVDRYPVEL